MLNVALCESLLAVEHERMAQILVLIKSNRDDAVAVDGGVISRYSCTTTTNTTLN